MKKNLFYLFALVCSMSLFVVMMIQTILQRLMGKL